MRCRGAALDWSGQKSTLHTLMYSRRATTYNDTCPVLSLNAHVKLRVLLIGIDTLRHVSTHPRAASGWIPYWGGQVKSSGAEGLPRLYPHPRSTSFVYTYLVFERMMLVEALITKSIILDVLVRSDCTSPRYVYTSNSQFQLYSPRPETFKR